MDFRLTPAQTRFRDEARAWLAGNLPPGSDTRRPETAAERVASARAWQRRLAEGGWAGLHWPREHGGRGATPIEQLLFLEEYVAAGAPDLAEIGIGPSLVGPTLIRHGTEEQRRRFLPRILTGEDLWCQGFSEPGAGSDLAALRTHAERRGDMFRVTGQKIWTSYAQHADWCILLARTGGLESGRRGFTFFLLDMRAPGITVRPLVEMTGAAWFNELFLDDVPIPAEHVVGTPGEGWAIAITTLAHERTVATPPIRLQNDLRAVLALARATGAAADARVRQRLARSAVEARIVRLLAYRQAAAAEPGPEGSALKLLWTEADQRLKELAIALEGPWGAVVHDAGRWQREWLWSRAATIYAGTSEVQRNIVAQRVLGLPREPRP
ncbi:MAG TPA: acyl-CoA dehydrogenase family protein [Candidatus Binatia bacterium]|nr:acyl-CoA dehydrogenase family protein [Candidatus Binatia bacterium]